MKWLLNISGVAFRGLPNDTQLYPSVSAVYGNTEVTMVYLGQPLDGWCYSLFRHILQTGGFCFLYSSYWSCELICSNGRIGIALGSVEFWTLSKCGTCSLALPLHLHVSHPARNLQARETNPTEERELWWSIGYSWMKRNGSRTTARRRNKWVLGQQ